jgi:hypothetical protein
MITSEISKLLAHNSIASQIIFCGSQMSRNYICGSLFAISEPQKNRQLKSDPQNLLG